MEFSKRLMVAEIASSVVRTKQSSDWKVQNPFLSAPEYTLPALMNAHFSVDQSIISYALHVLHVILDYKFFRLCFLHIFMTTIGIVQRSSVVLTGLFPLLEWKYYGRIIFVEK